MGYTTSCVFCGSIHSPVIDLGLHPHSDYFPKNNKKELKVFPLNLVRCTSCKLYQIDYHLDREFLFNEDYIYDSSINRGGQKHWQDFAKVSKDICKSSTKQLTHLDIGSNAGELNEAFTREDFLSYGVEPSKDPYNKAISLGRKSINSYFDRNILSKLPNDKFNVITFTNSFPHIPNPVETLTLAAELLNKDNGLLIIESPSARSMIERFQYDQIYHQHMTYLDYMPLAELANEIGLEIHHIIDTEFHNGSSRYYLSHKGCYELSTDIIKRKEDILMNQHNSSKEEDTFREGCMQKRSNFKNIINQYNENGKRICCVSAPAKGNTILNYCNISSHDIPFTTEANMLKVGRFTPLSSLPIKEDQYLKEYKPEAIVILAWNFLNEISTSIKRFIPNVKVIKPI